jgi:hypothetical protein
MLKLVLKVNKKTVEMAVPLDIKCINTNIFCWSIKVIAFIILYEKTSLFTDCHIYMR